MHMAPRVLWRRAQKSLCSRMHARRVDTRTHIVHAQRPLPGRPRAGGSTCTGGCCCCCCCCCCCGCVTGKLCGCRRSNMACCAWSMAFASSAWSTSKSDVPRALPPHTSTLTSATIALNKRVPLTSAMASTQCVEGVCSQHTCPGGIPCSFLGTRTQVSRVRTHAALLCGLGLAIALPRRLHGARGRRHGGRNARVLSGVLVPPGTLRAAPVAITAVLVRHVRRSMGTWQGLAYWRPDPRVRDCLVTHDGRYAVWTASDRTGVEDFGHRLALRRCSCRRCSRSVLR